MNVYYITFGSEGMPYRGGWVKVHADSDLEARIMFEKRFGTEARTKGGYLNFSFCYDERRFLSTKMAESGNYGAFCHEEIGGN